MASAAYMGLDYGSVRAALEMIGVKRKKFADTFAGIRIMEAAALNVLNKKE